MKIFRGCLVTSLTAEIREEVAGRYCLFSKLWRNTVKYLMTKCSKFQYGTGMVLAVAPEKVEEVKQRVKCYEIGKITPRVKQAVMIK